MWYEAVEPDAPLTQGDIVLDCPVVTWSGVAPNIEGEDVEAMLHGMVVARRADIIIMTQACDLEQDKVDTLIVCQHVGLQEYKEAWQEEGRNLGHGVGEKSWRRYCDHIKDGHVWNLAMLNRGEAGGTDITYRVVDFHEIFTIPKAFLNPLVRQRAQRRLRLLPPYREHLSQAFARFFMRVGLPSDIEKGW